MKTEHTSMKTRLTARHYESTICAVKRNQPIKTHIKNLFTCLGVAQMRSRACRGEALRSRVLPALITGLGLTLATSVTAQTFTTLCSFTAGNTNSSNVYTNSDGAGPNALILSGNTLYGTAGGGGTNGNGTVFTVNTDGTGITNLHTFMALSQIYSGTNSDGAAPLARVILSGNTLYGTAQGGGTNGTGTVFAVHTDGTGFTILHTFTAYSGSTNSDGATPLAEVILSGNTLYGTAFGGGSAGNGTVFAINTNGTGFTNLYSFSADMDNGNGYYTNSDGFYPQAGLILSGNTLYGTASGGGGADNGTIFAVNTNGGGFKTLHSFSASPFGTNSDGANPVAGLILSGNTLYGTASGGGTNGFGTVFAFDTDSGTFKTLHSFSAANSTNSSGYYTNSDGESPQAGLVLSGNTLYGTASEAGGSGEGTVFAIRTNGTDFKVLHSFTAFSGSQLTNSDGGAPSGLILSGNNLYGTAAGGGTNGSGTVFSITLPVPPPQLTITLSRTNVILSWPAADTGFTLQSTTNLASPAWITVSGQFAVTNPITDAKMFFRLMH